MQKKEKKKISMEKKPVKEKKYVLRKTQAMTAARIILWSMLGFVFLKGVQVSLQPNDEHQIKQTIADFKQQFASYKGENEEIMAFAQNFAREYLTYYEQNADGYKARIRPYVSDRLYEMADTLQTFKSSAEVTYVEAYRKEQYTENQFDVYVLAEVNYGTMINTSIIRIPVYTKGGAYIVEGMPMMVTDSILMAGFKQADYVGTAVTDAESVSIEVSVQNFLKAYYEEDADVIAYYLAKDADRNRFTGLHGRYVFEKLNSLNCYREEGKADIVAIAEVTIKDSGNENLMKQEYNLTIVNEDGRYYIKDFNTKTKNIK